MSICNLSQVLLIVDTSINNTAQTSTVRSRFAWRGGYLLAAFGIYMVDQSTKAWAVRALRFGDDRRVISGLLDLIYTENKGIAFGQLQEGGAFGRWFFVVLAVAALVLTVRLRTTLILDSQSITITTGRQCRVMAWSMIDRVKMQGLRVVLITKPEGRPDVTVINPRESTDAAFSALVAEIGTRLDADRGYKRLQ